MIAALQVPVVMMSLKRQAEADRRQAAGDYDENVLADLEIMELHAKIDRLTWRLT